MFTSVSTVLQEISPSANHSTREKKLCLRYAYCNPFSGIESDFKVLFHF